MKQALGPVADILYRSIGSFRQTRERVAAAEVEVQQRSVCLLPPPPPPAKPKPKPLPAQALCQHHGERERGRQAGKRADWTLQFGSVTATHVITQFYGVSRIIPITGTACFHPKNHGRLHTRANHHTLAKTGQPKRAKPYHPTIPCIGQLPTPTMQTHSPSDSLLLFAGQKSHLLAFSSDMHWFQCTTQ